MTDDKSTQKPADEQSPREVFVLPPELFVAVCEILQGLPWKDVNRVLGSLLQIKPVQAHDRKE